MRKLLLGLLLAEVLIFSVSTIPGLRDGKGFSSILDGWLQGAGYVTVAVVCLMRPLGSSVDRLAWSIISAALACRAIGFVLYLGWVRELDPIPYPSVADAGWIAMEVLLLCGLLIVARSTLHRFTLRIALDALVAALACAGVLYSLLYDTLVDLTAPGTPSDVVATNLAYPIADVMLLVVTFGILAGSEWRPPIQLWLLAAGVVGFSILDSVFLYQATAGTFRPGTPLSALSLASSALIALAGWVWASPRTTRRLDAVPGVLLPATLAVMCIALLVHASREPVPLSGVLLASAALLVAIVRTAVSFRDVRAIAEARTQARTDDLTGLPNRRAFHELFEKALDARGPQRPLALLIVDLDNFKDVNDTWGHHRGDELLTLVAPRLRLALREDDVLARIGGDEFAVVLTAGSAAMAADVAERLRRVLARPFSLVGRELTVEASIGIAVFPGDGEDAAELLLHADSAMYAAKGAPLGYSFFHPAEHASSRQRLETVDRLRGAIERSELLLHYQPQFSLRSGEVVGVEALLRWRRSEDELLAPTEFLPQAESGGLMRAVTLNVLEQAVRQAGRWRAAGIETKVGVNLSVTDLLDLEFPGQVQALLDAHRVHGGSIVLELTEDLFMADPTRGQEVIARLRRTGVDIWVDDYGTGFSSLGYLRDLRDIGGLKLDRSFVTGLDTDPRARAIVESTIALTNSLGLGLIAEGVETEGARDCLVELGCAHAQGFFLSRPVPAEECRFDGLEPARRALK